MARGNPNLVTADTAWEVIFDASKDGGGMTRAGLEAGSTNTGRVQYRYTTGKGLNYGSVAGGAYKLFGAGKNQMTKIEVQGDAAGQQFYFDAAVSED